MVLTFDTHRAVKGLKDAGFEEAQAEAVVTIFSEVMDGSLATKSDLKNLATKDDVAELRAEVKSDIAELRAEVKSDIAELRADHTDLRTEFAELKVGIYRQLWVMGIGIVSLNVATVGLAVAVMKFLP